MLHKTSLQHIPSVLMLYNQAVEDLAKANINQWQNNYPNQKSLLADIEQGFSYVFIKDGAIVGTCALLWDGDVDYDIIHDGSWLNDESYLTIHRIVVERSYKRTGTSHELMKAIIELAKENNMHNIRIDTHQDNLTMQGYLKKEGFVYCGIVYVNQKDKRLAFHKLL